MRPTPPLRWIAGALAAALLLAAAFVLDLVSGNEVSSSLFYVVGIGVAAWFVGQNTGLAVATLSAVAWATAVRLVGPGFSKPSVFYWNIAVELAIYVTTAIALARIRRGLAYEHQLTERVALARDALDREAKAVGDLQREMLPCGPPAIAGYEWQVCYATSREAGGDYYDFFALPGDRVGLLLADASGHGPQAAVLMAMMRVLLHTTEQPMTRPDVVLTRLGNQIAKTVPPGRFATACYVVLEPASGRLAFSLAGHPPPLLLRAASGTIDELPQCGGTPLGLHPQLPFDAGCDTLQVGDTLILYTDGLTEGMNRGQELFGQERLRAALSGTSGLSLEVLREQVMSRFDVHRAGAALEDDLTVIMLRRIAPREAPP